MNRTTKSNAGSKSIGVGGNRLRLVPSKEEASKYDFQLGGGDLGDEYETLADVRSIKDLTSKVADLEVRDAIWRLADRIQLRVDGADGGSPELRVA